MCDERIRRTIFYKMLAEIVLCALNMRSAKIRILQFWSWLAHNAEEGDLTDTDVSSRHSTTEAGK